MTRRLLFVYGNDSGTVNGLIHYVHKIVSPSTYSCSLCALTYGPMGKRAAWSNGLASLGVAADFLHRDEMVRLHGHDHPPLPAVFEVSGETPVLLIAKSEIDACRDLDALIGLLEARLHENESSFQV